MTAIPALATLSEDMKRVESKMRDALRFDNPALYEILMCILDSGGKRLRPGLALLAARMGVVDHERAIALAAAIELLHTATLVHDDLIDNSLLRRGKQTLNSQWSGGATVLAGDFMFACSASLAAETQNVRVVSIFADTLVTICRGELNQIFGPNWREQTPEDYYRRIYHKTASLFASSTQAGGVLCGLSEPETDALREYGRLVGMAFQIVDDLLDFTGTAEELGKPVGSDLRQGIVTLPTLYFLRKYPDDEALVRVLSRRAADEAEIVAVVRRIAGSEATRLAFDEAKRLIAGAKAALSALPDHPSREAMLEIADYVVARRV